MGVLCFRFAERQFRFTLDYDHEPTIDLGHFFELYQVRDAVAPFDGDYTVIDERVPIERPPDEDILFEYNAFFFIAHHRETGGIRMGVRQLPGKPWHLRAQLSGDFATGTIYRRMEVNGELGHNFLDFPLRDHLLSNRLAALGIAVCHASHVDYNGRSIMFIGPSDIGKSTAALQWQNAGHRLLNDERNAVFLRPDGTPMAATTPWRGSYMETILDCQPLAAIFVLAQAPENRLVRMPPIRALARLGANTFCFHYHKELYQRVLDTFGAVTARVPVYELHCTPDQRQVDAVKRELASLTS